MSDVDREFGANMKRLRKSQGRTQQWLVTATGQQINQGGVSKIESGLQSAYLSQALAIASALGVSLNELVAGVGPSASDVQVELADLRAENARLRAGFVRLAAMATSLSEVSRDLL